MKPPLAFTFAVLAITTTAAAFNGDMTWYSPGLGACGETHSENDKIVGLDSTNFGDTPNPNNNPSCKKHITINYNGKYTTAAVKDMCPGCSYGDIDASPAVFKELADLDDGRVQVEWEYS